MLTGSALQASNHAGLIERTLDLPGIPINAEASLKSSGKLKVLLQLLVKLTQCNHRVLVFCSMPKMLTAVENFLEWWHAQRGDKITYVRVGGPTVAARYLLTSCLCSWLARSLPPVAEVASSAQYCLTARESVQESSGQAVQRRNCSCSRCTPAAWILHGSSRVGEFAAVRHSDLCGSQPRGRTAGPRLAGSVQCHARVQVTRSPELVHLGKQPRLVIYICSAKAAHSLLTKLCCWFSRDRLLPMAGR